MDLAQILSSQSESARDSWETSISITGFAAKLEHFWCEKFERLGISNEIKQNLEAASGFEPLHRGFADLSLNHLGTPPWNDRYHEFSESCKNGANH